VIFPRCVPLSPRLLPSNLTFHPPSPLRPPRAESPAPPGAPSTSTLLDGVYAVLGRFHAEFLALYMVLSRHRNVLAPADLPASTLAPASAAVPASTPSTAATAGPSPAGSAAGNGGTPTGASGPSGTTTAAVGFTGALAGVGGMSSLPLPALGSVAESTLDICTDGAGDAANASSRPSLCFKKVRLDLHSHRPALPFRSRSQSAPAVPTRLMFGVARERVLTPAYADGGRLQEAFATLGAFWHFAAA